MAVHRRLLTDAARSARLPIRTRRGRRRTGLVAAIALAPLLASCSSTSAPQSSSADRTFTAGLAAEASGNRALAVADFLAVVKQDPRNKYAWYDLGDLADRAGQPAQAAADYRRSLGIDPGYVPALYNLAVLETATAPADAAALYQRVVRSSPHDAEAHWNLGYVLRTLGQASAGDAQIATALRLDPSLAGRGRAGAPSAGS